MLTKIRKKHEIKPERVIKKSYINVLNVLDFALYLPLKQHLLTHEIKTFTAIEYFVACYMLNNPIVISVQRNKISGTIKPKVSAQTNG